ncbi:MAG TPA: hypothetical protein PKX05_05005, partial [bacterium]|nr:hypothetical protein [bacterium]
LFSSQRKLEILEKIALALFNLSFHKMPTDAFDLFERSPDVICPQTQICWDNFPKIPLCVSLSEIKKYSAYLSDFLGKHGLAIQSICSQSVCARQFNNLCRNNLKKDYINYLQFEKIILTYHKMFKNITVTAGKIGGRKNYAGFVKKNLSDWRIITKQETADVSEYLLRKNDAEIALKFVRDIETKSFLGVLAGIYGKYIRQLCMTGINRFFMTEKFISGYRDKYTSAFIDQLQHKNPDEMDCILRTK